MLVLFDNQIVTGEYRPACEPPPRALRRTLANTAATGRPRNACECGCIPGYQSPVPLKLAFERNMNEQDLRIPGYQSPVPLKRLPDRQVHPASVGIPGYQSPVPLKQVGAGRLAGGGVAHSGLSKPGPIEAERRFARSRPIYSIPGYQSPVTLKPRTWSWPLWPWPCIPGYQSPVPLKPGGVSAAAWFGVAFRAIKARSH